MAAGCTDATTSGDQKCCLPLRVQKCRIQYVGSVATDERDNRLRLRRNNYKSSKQFKNRTLRSDKTVPRECLHKNVAQADHNGFHDFSFKIIDSADDLMLLIKRVILAT